MSLVGELRENMRTFDYALAIVVAGIAYLGILMVEAVARLLPIYAALPDQQRIHLVTGIILMLVVALVDYHFIAKFYLPIYFISIVFLVIVLFLGPDDITATARWIVVPIGGFNLSIQPSEFTKFFLIIALAALVDKRKTINHPLSLLLYLAMAGLPVVLVILQLSLSAATVLLAIGVIMLFLANLNFKIIIATLTITLPAAIFLYFDMMRQQPLIITQILSERQWHRLQSFIDPASVDPDALLQTNRSLFAIGSGGLYGRGFMENSTFVIHGHNDFIFAVMAEQFGFIGSMTLLAAIGFVIVKCFLIAYRAEDMLGRLMAGGVGGLLLFQTFVNVSVVTGFLPNTGMPFPFMSYGGTHMWTHMAAIGLALNVGISRKEIYMFTVDEEEEEPAITTQEVMLNGRTSFK